MRKFLVLGFFLIVFYLVFLQEAQAQGTFSCFWDYSSSPPGCVPDLINHHCDSGYTPDSSACIYIRVVPECNRQQNIPCISTTPPSPAGPCEENEETWTALGCIPNDPRDFVAWLLARAIGIGGGIAFLLMIWGGFQVITSAGDPDRLNAGKEVITSAIAGLLLIILSLFLLQLIGVQILAIPGFGKP